MLMWNQVTSHWTRKLLEYLPVEGPRLVVAAVQNGWLRTSQYLDKPSLRSRHTLWTVTCIQNAFCPPISFLIVRDHDHRDLRYGLHPYFSFLRELKNPSTPCSFHLCLSRIFRLTLYLRSYQRLIIPNALDPDNHSICFKHPLPCSYHSHCMAARPTSRSYTSFWTIIIAEHRIYMFPDCILGVVHSILRCRFANAWWMAGRMSPWSIIVLHHGSCFNHLRCVHYPRRIWGPHNVCDSDHVLSQ